MRSIFQLYQKQRAVRSRRHIRVREERIDERTHIQNRLKFALEGANDGLWDWDVKSGHHYLSDRWQSMLGYGPGELAPHVSSWERLVHPEDKLRVVSALREHLKGGTDYYSSEIRMRAKSGEWMWILTRGKVFVRDEAGEPLRVTGTHTDITELKRTQSALEDAKEQAVAANKAKTQFLTNMSHELRTPLNAIIGFAELMNSQVYGPLGDAKYTEYVKDIQDSGQHLLQLINDILDLSKIESGRAELHEADVDVRKTILGCMTLIADRARSEQLEVVCEIERDELPFLRADERMLRQILLNLFSNAVKFTPPGGRIVVSAPASLDGRITVCVRDTGIGLAPDDIPTALTRFGQVDGRLNRKFEGTGLGLPLAKSLVELHGGTLEIESTVNVGTTITIQFPAERVVEPRAADRAAS